MITALDNTAWSLSDLTGNACFVQQDDGTLYVVSNVRADGTFVVLCSTDYGRTFTQVAWYQFSAPSGSLDPAVALDGSGNLHIIGTQPSGDKFDLLKFVFNIGTSTLYGPVTLASAARIRSAYDIVCLSSGHTFVALALTNGQTNGSPAVPFVGNNLVGLELDALEDIVSVVVLGASTSRSGDVFGNVSLYSPDGVVVELYHVRHAKVLQHIDRSFYLSKLVRDSGKNWGAAAELSRWTGRSTDDKLTVVGDADKRYLTHLYYTQVGQGKQYLAGNLLLGYFDGGNWTFNFLAGTPAASYSEPVTCLYDIPSPAATGWKVAYLLQNFTRDGTAPLQVADVSFPKLNLNPEVGFFNTLNFTWLRGTKSKLDSTSRWLVVGEREVAASPASALPVFVSGYNVPPVAALTPGTATIRRQQLVTLDASGSSDADLDTLKFTWGCNDSGAILTSHGATATLLVPNSVGPAARTITVTVTVEDLNREGQVIHTGLLGQTATCVLTVPLNHAPTVSFAEDPITVSRNSPCTLAPTIADADVDVLSYQWEQISGTPVALTSGTQGGTLSLTTNGVNVAGETLTFRLTVNDAVNAPVVSTVDVVVPSRLYVGVSDTQVLSRSMWSGTLALRNTNQTWDAFEKSVLYTDFLGVRRSTTLDGNDRVLYISPWAALVFGSNNGDTQALLRRLYPPYDFDGSPITGQILDACHLESEQTVLLTNRNFLFRYSSAPLINSDAPDATLDLSAISNFVFTKLFATASHGNKRVLVLAGADGCLLVQVASDLFTVEGYMELSGRDNLLYGADNVQWVRTSNVESLRQGKVLVGTVDAHGATYETLIDLPHRGILGMWDASKLRNQTVTTGEILFEAQDGYIGKPAAPVVNTPVVNGTVVTLLWTQERSDLVEGYNVQQSVDDGESWSQLERLSSGAVKSLRVNVFRTSSYKFRVQAAGRDGLSPYSNVVSVN